MFYYNYSPQQLEKRAMEALEAFDKELLYKTKQIDVYAVIEKLLDVPYDWKYLTPDQSVLGATAFNQGYIWAWPERLSRGPAVPRPPRWRRFRRCGAPSCSRSRCPPRQAG